MANGSRINNIMLLYRISTAENVLFFFLKRPRQKGGKSKGLREASSERDEKNQFGNIQMPIFVIINKYYFYAL